jgi:hypothetical protein
MSVDRIRGRFIYECALRAFLNTAQNSSLGWIRTNDPIDRVSSVCNLTKLPSEPCVQDFQAHGSPSVQFGKTFCLNYWLFPFHFHVLWKLWRHTSCLKTHTEKSKSWLMLQRRSRIFLVEATKLHLGSPKCQKGSLFYMISMILLLTKKIICKTQAALAEKGPVE